MTRVVAAALTVITSVGAVRGAAPQASSTLAFEVATIKQNRSVDTSGSCCDQPGGRLRMINGNTASLIRYAYPTESGELVGAPGWVASDRYDVLAKGEGAATPADMRQMVRALLAERFKLTAHVAAQERAIFALVRVPSGGRISDSLHRMTVDCDAVREARRMGRRPDAPLPANGAPLCGYSGSGASMKFGGVTMSLLAEYLRSHVERVVIDRTGLEGNYEFTLDYALQPGGTATAADVFTAVQEQLGLKLVPDRAPVQVVVVDRIERPTED